MKGIIIAAAVACIALIGLGIFFTVHQGDSGPRILAMDPSYTQRVADGYWKKGSDNPKVVIDEFADFQCPGCRSMYAIVDQVIRDMSDTVQLHYHHYVLSGHDKSLIATKAAEAAGRQGKFWDMHQIIFASQLTWVNDTPATFKNTTVVGYAKSLNLNEEQFRRDMADSSIEDPINRDKTAGNNAGVDATPTILINGVKLDTLPQSVEDFEKVVKTAAEAVK